MKFLLLYLFFALAVGGAMGQDAERPTIYPWDVKVGGVLAKIEGEPPIFARAPKAVKNDALVELESGPGMVIAKVFRCDKSGEIAPADEAQPGMILANQTSKFQLNQMKNKEALKPGFYIMSIVVFGKGSSRVLFEVEEGAEPEPAAAPAGKD
ncbi:MAG: hypothetical protein ACI9R3_004932 [Verrucomicrobiales bacterium]|jgi:hypothetical protein